MRFPFADRISELTTATLYNVKGLLVALSGGALIWLVLLSPIGVLSMFDSYKEYQQAERLLDCMKAADDKWIAELCRHTFDVRLEDRAYPK